MGSPPPAFMSGSPPPPVQVAHASCSTCALSGDMADICAFQVDLQKGGRRGSLAGVTCVQVMAASSGPPKHTIICYDSVLSGQCRQSLSCGVQVTNNAPVANSPTPANAAPPAPSNVSASPFMRPSCAEGTPWWCKCLGRSGYYLVAPVLEPAKHRD